MPISKPGVILPAKSPVRPVQGSSTSALGARAGFSRKSASLDADDPDDPDDPDGACPASTRALGEDPVTYTDRTLNCVDCGVEFIHSAADQEFYAQKGFASDPKRCTSCRASRRAARDGGYDVREIGGPRGYERSDDRPAREYFAVVCSSCGNQAQVPFKPRMDRPVYCSDCFRTVKPG
jgi:CxxC-x17-CxxC domain-containing protein